MNTLTFLMAHAPKPPKGWIKAHQSTFIPAIKAPELPSSNPDEIELIENWQADLTWDLPNHLANYQEAYHRYLDHIEGAKWKAKADAIALWNYIWALSILDRSEKALPVLLCEQPLFFEIAATSFNRVAAD